MENCGKDHEYSAYFEQRQIEKSVVKSLNGQDVEQNLHPQEGCYYRSSPFAAQGNRYGLGESSLFDPKD